MILEIDNVELSFSNKRLLNGIYLKAETGKITAILGSNGCGKSCLLQILFGALQPKYKLVRIDNKPITKPLYLTKNVSLLPQYHFIPKGLKLKTIFKTLEVSWESFTTIFEGFSKYKNSKIHLLSGGERRLVETYLIVKGKSEIILLDEPFSHIAPLYMEKLKRLITEEKQHKIIIITDHMYKDVIETADSIYLLRNGYTKQIKNLKDLAFYNYLSANSIH
ncbi:MAG: ABC transporter ATP-binding protein [Oceanihabitans sp.]|nr:ABC transporter ATP-binding protein [Oceanihabitans sp.]